MAKGQRRSNRENKKPKQVKPKPAPGAPSSIAAAKMNPVAGGKKK